MRTPHLRAISAPQTVQVALYARVCSDQQAEHHTIDSQLAELTAQAEQN
jgi:site-specific DNA recombinase